MAFSTLLIFPSVLLASIASVLSSAIDGADPSSTFKGFSFSVVPTSHTGQASSFDNHTLQNDANMQYIGKVNVGGQDFNLQVDTGSSDIYLVKPGPNLKVNSTSKTTVNLTFGIGSAYGNIAYAPVSFGGYRVDNQAFLNVTSTDDDGQGLVGIGLNGLNALQRSSNDGSAQSVMASMFAQHPTLPRFMGLALERSEDGESTAGGYISIGEYDPQFNNVTNMPKNPVTPASGARWTIAMDGMSVNGNQFTLKSSVKGTAKGKAIALIDSGTSYAYIPSDAVNAIYSRFDGSVHVKVGGGDVWYVPCLGQVNVSFTFANVAYPINPMELSIPINVTIQNKSYTVCASAFQPGLNGFAHEVDFLLGDIFMRNVYSVFNFGNSSTTYSMNADAIGASIQLLSRTNRDQAFIDFQNRRRKSLEMYPPLLDLTKLHSNGSIDGVGTMPSHS